MVFDQASSCFNPSGLEDLREQLVFSILRRWSVPAIEFGFEDKYEKDDTSRFIVKTFGAEYVVTIEKTK